MADSKEKIDYKFDERLRQVEQILASHLAKCNESTENVKKSLDSLTGQVMSFETSVNEMKTEVSKAQGMAIGGKQVLLFSISLVTVISLMFGIIQFLGNN